MKRFFEEHTSVVIICIVVSLLLCIVGGIKNFGVDGSLQGTGLSSILGNTLLDQVNSFQNQLITTKSSSIIQCTKEFNNKIAINSVDFPNSQDSIDITITGKNLTDGSSKTVDGDNAHDGLGPEFLRFSNMALIFNKYGKGPYTLSFDLKSKDTSNTNVMRVYNQNGAIAKYQIWLAYPQDGYKLERNYYIEFNATTEWKRYFVVITANLINEKEPESWLAFYGNYGTGNIPVVKNVQLEYGNKIHSYEEKKSKTITVTKDTKFPIYVDGYGEGTTITNSADANMNITY